MSQESTTFATAIMKNGAVVQMVRILACHARGREFEPRPHRRGVFHHGRLLAFCGQLSPAAPRGRGFPALRSESGKAGTSLVRTAEKHIIMLNETSAYKPGFYSLYCCPGKSTEPKVDDSQGAKDHRRGC